MRSILPIGLNPDVDLHAWLGEALDPERRVLAALERIMPLAGKRIADVGTGIGHYPMLLAKHTGRTYGIESEPELLAVARRRADAAHQPNLRIVEGTPDRLPLRDAAVDLVLHGSIEPSDSSRPLIAEALRVLRPGGRLVVIGYYGRDDLSGLLEPERVSAALDATQRGAGWWLRNGFKIKVVHARLELGDLETAQRMLPRLYGDRGLARLMGAPTTSLRIRLGLYHLAAPGLIAREAGAPRTS